MGSDKVVGAHKNLGFIRLPQEKYSIVESASDFGTNIVYCLHAVQKEKPKSSKTSPS